MVFWFSILSSMDTNSPVVVLVQCEQKDSKCQRLSNTIAVFSVFVLSVICMAVVITKLKETNKSFPNTRKPLHSYPKVNDNGTLQIISRDEWLAQPARNKTTLQLPVPLVILGNTATEECSKKAMCLLRVNTIQSLHMDIRRWDDIGYNFLIGNDGYVYEGRGWDNQGAHTKGFNSRSLGVSFLGHFVHHLPSERAFVALKLLLEEGVRAGKISEDYVIYCQRQLRSDLKSPGQELYEEIMTFDRWKEYGQEV
ncbi:PGLYRP3.2 family protein [Megaselia abdita]